MNPATFFGCSISLIIRSTCSFAPPWSVPYNAATGKGEQRVIFNTHANKLRAEMVAGTFTPGTEAEEKDIYVMRADGTRVRRLTDSAGLDEGPVWSPDGTKIAFSSDRDGQQEIYVMDADGSNPRRLTANPARDESPDWQALPFDGSGHKASSHARITVTR